MGFKFLKTGAAAEDLAKKHAAEVEANKLKQGQMYRFWLKAKEEAKITFVDGNLNSKGVLEAPRFYEHQLLLNNTWNNFFVCPEKTNPGDGESCPICADDDRPSLVAVFTIIDHRKFPSKDKTKVYENTRKLMVVKPHTFERLNKLAIKRKGLAGATFDVSRLSEKDANVGSDFDFVEKRDIEELKALYTREVVDPKTNAKSKVTNFEPADYEKEIKYYTGDELRKKGIGTPNAQVETTPEAEDETDYAGKL